MNKLFDRYPKFYSGEILTPEKLNDITAYSDNQTQITRTELLGYGIVSGLTYNYTYNYSSKAYELTILPGVAITPDGRAIIIEKSVTYRYMEKLQDEKFQLVENKTDKSFLLNKNSNQVLVIRYDLENEKMFQCLQDSCDIVNERTLVKFRPILVPVKTLKKACVKDNPPMDYMRLYRFNEVADSLVTNFLHDTVRSYFNKNVNIVISCYNDIAKRFDTNDAPLRLLFLGRKSDTLQNEFRNAIQILNKLKKQSLDPASMHDYKSKSDAASPEIPVYYLHFLEDIEDAYNEWKDYYTYFLNKYHNHIYRPEIKMEDDTVMIGIKGGADDDSYRNHFISTIMSESIETDTKMLQMLLHRMCAMVMSFYRTSYKWNSQSVKINSVSLDKTLKCRPIPFYYRVDESFIRAWTLDTNSVKTGNSTQQVQYDGSIMVNAFNNPSNYYQVGGYYNRSIESVMSELKNIISANNLHLNVETIELKEIERQWYDDMKKNFTITIPRTRISRLKGERTTVARIPGKMLRQIYANKAKILLLLRRSHMYERMSLADRHALMETIKNFDLEQAKKEADHLVTPRKNPKTKSVIRTKIKLDFTILAYLQAIAEQCLSEKYRFADHRFIPRKSTLYVAIFKGKVIFCFGA